MNRQQLEERVRLAVSRAKPWSEIEPHELRQKKLVNLFLSGKINLEQFDQGIHNLEYDIGTLYFYTPTDFVYALECFHATREQIETILQEQVSHYKEGLRLSLPTRLSITPYKTVAGKLALIPGIQCRIDRLMKQEIVRSALTRINALKRSI